MGKKSFLNRMLKLVSNLGWWIYVKVSWRKNPNWQAILLNRDLAIRDNLGYYVGDTRIIKDKELLGRKVT